MPTYDYLCENCGHEFEQFQTIKSRPLRKCPVCKKASLKRLIGAGAGLIFKGSGFYETDYRSENYKKAKESEKCNIPKGKTTTKDAAKKEPETKAKPAKKDKSTPGGGKSS